MEAAGRDLEEGWGAQSPPQCALGDLCLFTPSRSISERQKSCGTAGVCACLIVITSDTAPNRGSEAGILGRLWGIGLTDVRWSDGAGVTQSPVALPAASLAFPTTPGRSSGAVSGNLLMLR